MLFNVWVLIWPNQKKILGLDGRPGFLADFAPRFFGDLFQQPGVAAVPRALEHHEIEEDLDLFDFTLTDDEMARIGALREKDIRVVDPPQRRPVWDIG